MRELKLRTPEGVTFSFLLAGPAVRMLACLLDLGAVGVISQVISQVLLLASLISYDFAMGLTIASYLFIGVSYGILLEYYWQGQTLGKRLLKLRVVDAQGMHLTLSQVIVRNLFRVVDQLPAFYLVGGSVCAFTRYHQRLGDLAANTVVIRHPALKEPDTEALGTPAFNSLRQHPHLVARLRQRVTPQQAALLVDALVRRETFAPEQRLVLFQELADFCRSLVEFPPETTEFLTDEQMLRNIVDVIFEKARWVKS